MISRFGRSALLTALLPVVAGGAAAPALGADPLAIAFGARPTVTSASISPDGKKIGLIFSGEGQAGSLRILDVDGAEQPVSVLKVSGNPDRLDSCNWIANDRLICSVSTAQSVLNTVVGASNLFGVNADGGNLRVLEARRGPDALSVDLRGGQIVDLLPQEDGAALLMRSHVPEARLGSSIARKDEGLGVDRVDTRTGRAQLVEHARPDAVRYVSDGQGHLRLLFIRPKVGPGYDADHMVVEYRTKASNDWQRLNDYNVLTGEGFYPIAVDAATDRAIGFLKMDGRDAVVAVKLDGTGTQDILYRRPDVDVDSVLTIGRQRTVVGASYSTDYRHNEYFDGALKTLTGQLAKALGGDGLALVDSAQDQSRLLLISGSATDPGQIYLFDRTSRKLQPIVAVRPPLATMKLADTSAISYPAADGTMIPAYLTVPPGKEAKGLPAMVLPHGGPSSRDEGGFDWLVQYFVARGFAVLQPNFRGSAGYGDQWFVDNGFRSWKIAIGDVVDAGRWLTSQGIAAPDRLVIAGWSYGGYAALQSAVVAPDLFKAVVAIAPVTDLGSLVADEQKWSDFRVVKDFVGTGPHLKEGSPAQNVDRIKAPVLLFHGTLDRNVDIHQSRLMENRLEDAGKKSSLVVFEGLDHQIDDGAARAQMIEQAADFLLAAGK